MTNLKKLLCKEMSVSRRRSDQGAALIIMIFFFVIISLATIETATVGAITELRTYETIASSKSAYASAEAGIEDVYYRILNGKPIPDSESLTLNGAVSTVTSVPVSDTQKDVYVMGNARNQEVRKLFLSVSKANTSVPIAYGAQGGEGGITMYANTLVNGTGLAKGDLYSNGQIVGDASTARVIGNVISSSAITPDQVASSTVCVNNDVLGVGGTNLDYAQSFTLTGTDNEPLTSMSFYIKRTGSPTGKIQITEDDGGKPAKTAIATQSVTSATTGTNYAWVPFAFTTPATLVPGQIYWVVFDTSAMTGKTWIWCRSDSDTYPTGQALAKSDWTTSGAWTTLTGDMTFISFGGGTSKIQGVKITGSAKADAITTSTVSGDAYYHSIDTTPVSGTKHPASPTPPYVPLPLTETVMNQWKADAELGGVINGNCGLSGVSGCNADTMSLGPVKINGNLNLVGSKTVTITGTVYVTGNVDIGDGGSVSCSFFYGAKSCVIIADGYINTTNNAHLLGSGTSGSFILALSTKKGCLGAGGTGCTTNSSAIEVGDNGNGALYYAPYSLIDIFDNAKVTAVVGYMIALHSHAEINFDAKVAGITILPSVTGVTSSAWNVNQWNEY
jgi:hypothetical protein